jgi:CheY-like chemotaxis protein
MIIDDDDHLRDAMVLMLEDRGYTVGAYAEAELALAQLKAGGHPDLILLDLMMPGMNGWEFRIQQKQQPEWADIPVIALSADRSPQAAAIDSHAYLAKPFEPRVLLGTVDDLLRTVERQRFEARTRELERLGSLGMMAAGIAHEINNPLAFMAGNLELAVKQCADLEVRLASAEAFSLVGIRQLLTRANRGTERIAAIVRGIALFATADTNELISVDLGQLIKSTLQLVANELRHIGRLERNIGLLPRLSTNPGKLAQVLLSLLLHAIHAMRDSGGRDHVLRVRAERHTDGERDDVIVSISDTRRGLSPVRLRQMFEPLFSTKTHAGIGLSGSHDLVEQLGGSLIVESRPEIGTTFHVILPLRASASMPPAAAYAPRLAQIAWSKTRARPRLLVIDDEPLLCKLLEMLLVNDYDVVALSQPDLALMRILDGEEFDLILCDVMMPDVTGIELYERAIAQRPEVTERFVFMTGGAFSEPEQSFLVSSRSPQLRKPFRQAELLETIEARLSTKH